MEMSNTVPVNFANKISELNQVMVSIDDTHIRCMVEASDAERCYSFKLHAAAMNVLLATGHTRRISFRLRWSRCKQ